MFVNFADVSSAAMNTTVTTIETDDHRDWHYWSYNYFRQRWARQKHHTANRYRVPTCKVQSTGCLNSSSSWILSYHTCIVRETTHRNSKVSAIGVLSCTAGFRLSFGYTLSHETAARKFLNFGVIVSAVRDAVITNSETDTTEDTTTSVTGRLDRRITTPSWTFMCKIIHWLSEFKFKFD